MGSISTIPLDSIHIAQVWPEISKTQAPWPGVKLESAIPISIFCNRNLCWNCHILVLPEGQVIIGDVRKKILWDRVMQTSTWAHWAHLCWEPGLFFWIMKHWMSALQDDILCMYMTAQAKYQNSHFLWLVDTEVWNVQTKTRYPLERSHYCQ